MNVPLLIAAILCFLIGAAHSLLGQKYVVDRIGKFEIRLRGDAVFMQRVVTFAWHLTTVLFWGFGAILLNMSLGMHALIPDKTIVGWTFAVSALLALVGSRGRHYSWIVFTLIAILIFVSGPRA